MTGLREIKKKNTKKAILQYAEKVFKEKGYSKVKTSDIAKGSNIAEGTLFNYFSSKGELFVEAVFRDFDMGKYKIHLSEKIDEDILVNEIVNLIDFYIKKMANVDKKLLREYFSVVYSINNSESLVARNSLFRMDEMVMEESKQLLNLLKKGYEKIEEFDLDIAVECIYSCVILQFTKYTYSDEFSYSNMIENIREQIRFIIRGSIL
ncbi:TetR/AcrR family transcriptional regulator [Sporosalibacterium faouarense]|uniref:TetR/AcrR family transcriptional regulator n=1 Tax=Sporosalibacterium faouarense TaxID=516123 RepID=UPI00141CD2E5|nr:TetR/AcrR family transcriptional regulator [Sporosalibacterium faouarense]MTI46253.1 TetR/AcrR family transcriptional regulator [Bacillota bacterium]